MPAYWQVTLDAAGLGVAGDAAATYSGDGLELNPMMPTVPVAGGARAAVVEAPTAADAVRQALYGTVTVGLPWAGRSADYVWSAADAVVGPTEAYDRPFWVERAGPEVGPAWVGARPAEVDGLVAAHPSTAWVARLEDLLGFGGHDGDWDDRWWAGTVAAYAGAPVVSRPTVYVTADGYVAEGLVLEANGFDPEGQATWAQVIDYPDYGRLEYHFDYLLGDYEITYVGDPYYSGYYFNDGVVLDEFRYVVTDGTNVSEPVTVEILGHSGIIPPGIEFPGLVGSNRLYGDYFGPQYYMVRQGNLNDCWFVSAAAGVARRYPNQIRDHMLWDGGFAYGVSLPADYLGSYTGIRWIGVPNREIEPYWSTTNWSDTTRPEFGTNGDWLAALEKGYGDWLTYTRPSVFATVPFTHSTAAANAMDRDSTLSEGIRALTGRDTRTDFMATTTDYRLRRRLDAALSAGKVVTAGIRADSPIAVSRGFVERHAYTVMGYDWDADLVYLRNPWGYNNLPPSPAPEGVTFAPDGGPNITVNLSIFRESFDMICYEQ